MAGAPKPGGGSQEYPRVKGLQEAGFEGVIRSRGSFFFKKADVSALPTSPKTGNRGWERKGEGLRAQCLSLFHPLSFGRSYERVPPLWGRDTKGKHLLMRETCLDLGAP